MSTTNDGGPIMSDTASKMPARIWAENTPDYGVWFDYRKDVDDVRYIRADIVERMAEAVSETIAKFDACDRISVRNTPLGIVNLRRALNSYRGASNDKA